MQLREMAQSYPTTAVDVHFELKVVNFAIGGHNLLGSDLAVNNNFHKSLATLYEPAMSRSVQIDGVANNARPRGCS